MRPNTQLFLIGLSGLLAIIFDFLCPHARRTILLDFMIVLIPIVIAFSGTIFIPLNSDEASSRVIGSKTIKNNCQNYRR